MDRETEEALCGLQAQVYAHHVALRALARTHPDPVGLLAEWREALIESTTTSPVAPAHTRNSEYLADQMRAFTEDWTAELVTLAIPSPGVLPV